MSKDSIKIRRVNKNDARFLWHLANDPEVREESLSTAAIPWEDHVKWLNTRLNDPFCLFFVVVNDKNEPFGQVRYDILNGEATISISIKKDYRGKSYGAKVISISAKKLFESTNAVKINAYIKPNNRASISLFSKANFKSDGVATVAGVEVIHFILPRGEGAHGPLYRD